jgi:citrate synthase
MLPSEEAARRLGVKVSTLYAYVSRGLLASHPEPGGRRSLFELSDIERMATRQRGGRPAESGLAAITTGVTQLRPDGPYYRGRPATELASILTFEEVADLLWGAESEGDWISPDLGVCPLGTVSDRMLWALVMCGARDPSRADLRPAAVHQAARRVIAALSEVVGPNEGLSGAPADDREAAAFRNGQPATPSIALRLAHGLTAGLTGGPDDGVGGHGSGRRAAQWTAALNAALILMADHELATSTVAVRVAASTRADLYDALLAGVATMAGPLHGAASQGAYELLVTVERNGASRAITDVLSRHDNLPGFGHKIYKERDPRFVPLWELARPLLTPQRCELFLEILELAGANGVPLPNCDLALAALSWGTGMPPDAGRTIFTVARLAGWTAHYQEELQEPPLRFRPRAVYSV